MAALPYMQLYVADYLADTVHFSTEEHGAYMLIMMNYFQTAKPIPKNRLQSISRLSNERWTVVERALNEMFNDTGTHWEHKRIDADLKLIDRTQTQRSKAGKASAESRKRQSRDADKTASDNKRSTVVQQEGNDRSTNKEQIRTDKNRTDNKKTNTRKPAKKHLTPPDWMPEKLWADYLVSRKEKRHVMNDNALTMCINAIDKHREKYGLDFILGKMIERGWGTCRADWLDNASGDTKLSNHGDFDKRNYSSAEATAGFNTVGGDA